MSNVTNSVATYNLSNLPTTDVVKKWGPDKIKEFLQRNRAELKIEENDINVIYGQKVTGRAFLRLNEEQLTRDHGSFKLRFGPALSIADLVKQINGESTVATGHVRAHPSFEYSDTIKWRKRLKEYRETVTRGLEANSPSVGSIPENFFKDQQTNPILNGQPIENTGPPITLYNNTFSQFLNNFNNVNLEIPSDFLSWTVELIVAVTNFYDHEGERNEKIRELLSKKLGTILLIEYGKKKRSDGMIITTIGLNIAYLGIFEGKNEIGTATIRGGIYYRDYWSQQNVDLIRNCCCAPSFIIAMAGSWFCILGGVFLSRVVIQPLTDFIPLTVNLRAPVQVKRIARLFYSLFLALHQLNRFYQNLNLEQLEQSEQFDQRFFPYVRQYQSGEERFFFTYLSELSDDHSRTIWKAKRDDGQMIVVKFVPKYSSEAHNICAKNGLAPNLLYYSDDDEAKKLGGFRMVIMEYIYGISLDQKYINGDIKAESCESIYKDVVSAIQLLHDNDFVFADLRAPNILVVDNDAMLIDFDWCGKHNVDKYPPSMNKELPWPQGAKPCALLQKEHDLYWLASLHVFLSPSDTFEFKLPDSASGSSSMSSASIPPQDVDMGI